MNVHSDPLIEELLKTKKAQLDENFLVNGSTAVGVSWRVRLVVETEKPESEKATDRSSFQ